MAEALQESSTAAKAQNLQRLRTQILAIQSTHLGKFTAGSTTTLPLEDWNISLDTSSADANRLQRAVSHLRDSKIPVAFPTETVYGLGANATNSAAVRGIYRAKQRPADNPLIVHIASIKQLRALLRPNHTDALLGNGGDDNEDDDPIPEIYKPLIKKFWPGPLTIILPNPPNSSLAPEVTAGLSTFGARMPRNLLALVLIKLANVPVAAPSANASTKPSPTAAEHVLHDLDGRIEYIVDGGPCDVGVESTVVDGLSSPPAVLRPGGISLDQIRACPGWEATELGYKDVSEKGGAKPKAPGMKYRHYSPKARVVLFEAGVQMPRLEGLRSHVGERKRMGFVRTRTWKRWGGETVKAAKKPDDALRPSSAAVNGTNSEAELVDAAVNDLPEDSPLRQMLQELSRYQKAEPEKLIGEAADDDIEIWDMQLGPGIKDIARGLFSALRDLDLKNVDSILVEGVADSEGDVAAAVMNRLRKAAEVNIEST